MSTLFISHSSEDAELAAELARRLREEGHHSLFLDFDPARGIPAGQSWERTLYRKLRAAKAVVALCTDRFIASRWCFAEVALARMEGKLVFALQADPLTQPLPAILTDRQLIDLRGDPEEGYGRLSRGLEQAELLRVDGEWDPGESPYLGLDAYHEEHAPIFFGREDETRAGLELLARGAPGMIVVVGASGSGKSSLVRAAIVPALRREAARWLVVEPFRPGRDPFVELAVSLLAELARHDPERSGQLGGAHELARELAGSPASDAEAADPDSPSPSRLIELALDLRRAARRRDCRVLLVVDQLEEALGRDRAGPRCDRFLALLRAAVEAPQSPLMVLATLPSDFLEPFQRNPALRGIDFESLSLGPMRIDGMRRVIEEPARLTAIELEPGLADRLLADTETPDALPLLSFTLWVLWRDYRDDGKLEVREYEQLGGLDRAVAAEADALLAGAVREGKEDELRSAFLRLARLTPEGRYARRPAPWEAEELAAVRPLLERFVERRLLVRRAEGDTAMVEVAHEALFRSWVPLRGWLDNNRAEMLLRQQIQRDSELWRESGRLREHLWSGGRLQQAGELLGRAGLEPEERRFVAAGLSRRRARRRALAAVTLAVLVTLTGFLLWALREKDRSERARRTAENLARAGLGSTLVEDDPTHANLLLLEVEQPGELPFVMAALHRALAAPLKTFLASPAEFEIAQSFNRDGTLLASVGSGYTAVQPEESQEAPAAWTVTVWDASSGRPHREIGTIHGETVAEFSPVRDHLLSMAGPGALQVTDVATGETVFRKELPGLWLAVYAQDGRRIAALASGEVHVLDAVSGEKVSSFAVDLEIDLGIDRVALAMTPRIYYPIRFDGERLAVSTVGGDSVSVWEVDTPRRLSVVEGLSESIVDFSLRSDRLLTQGDGVLRLRDLRTGHLLGEIYSYPDEDEIFATFDPDGRRVAVMDTEGPPQVLDVGDPPPTDSPGATWPPTLQLEDPRSPDERGETGMLEFTADGRRVVGGTLWAGRAGVWDGATGRLLMTIGGSAMATSRDGAKVANLHKVIEIKGDGGGVYPAEILQLPADAELARFPGEDCSWCDEALRGAAAPAQELVAAPGGRRWARETVRKAGDDESKVVELLGADRGLLRAVSGAEPRFSADGRYLLTRAALAAMVWDAESTRRVALLTGHAAKVTEALFTADGAWVITASAEDGTVRVWHTESGTPIAVLPWSGSGDPIPLPEGSNGERGLAVRADGSRLVTQSVEGRRIWALSGELLQALIRSRTNLCLEPEQRSKRLAEPRETAWAAYDRCERCLGRCPAPALREEWLGESPEAAAAAHAACLAGLEAEPAAADGGLEQRWRAWRSCTGGAA